MTLAPTPSPPRLSAVRLLTSRRWLGLAVILLLFAGLCVRAGLWQFSRHAERRALNNLLEANSTIPVARLSEVVSPGTAELPTTVQWRRVQAQGTYDAGAATLLRNRTREGRPGTEMLVPLITADGPAVLVNRGWQPARGPLLMPATPSGTVTVVGRLRAGENVSEEDLGRSEGPPRSVARLDPRWLAQDLSYSLVPGLLELVSEQPSGEGLIPAPAPKLGLGPHLAYGMQWFVFAAFAPGGFVLLARRELRDQTSGAASNPPSGK